MRCLTLARALHSAGAGVDFLCREHEGNMCDFIAASGFRVHRLPRNSSAKPAVDEPHAHWLGATWEEDAGQSLAAIAQITSRIDWLIVDHYALDWRWEKAARSVTASLMVIDDLADRRHDCDVLLDQNLNLNFTTRYDELIPFHCRRLLGPRYALLRPEFSAARAKPRVRDGVIRRLLIFFGGIDPKNETAKALGAISALHRPDIEVDVIVGPGNPHLANIRSLCAGLPSATVHHDPPDIAGLMAKADLAIGATGATTWERCCLGLPSIVISLAANQESIAQLLADQGLAIYLGRSESVGADSISTVVWQLLADAGRVAALSHACADIVDGRGTQRTARTLDKGRISLRRAGAADSAHVYQWRNAAETRRYSHGTSVISPAEHHDWYRRVLDDPARVLLIAECGGQPVGVLRYDCQEPQCTISVYLVPGQYGRGYGSRLLCAGHEWLKANRPALKWIRAEVLTENLDSAAAFLQAGYQPDGPTYVRRLS